MLRHIIKNYENRLSLDKKKSNTLLKLIADTDEVITNIDVYLQKNVKDKFDVIMEESKSKEDDKRQLFNFIIQCYLIKNENRFKMADIIERYMNQIDMNNENSSKLIGYLNDIAEECIKQNIDVDTVEELSYNFFNKHIEKFLETSSDFNSDRELAAKCIVDIYKIRMEEINRKFEVSDIPPDIKILAADVKNNSDEIGLEDPLIPTWNIGNQNNEIDGVLKSTEKQKDSSKNKENIQDLDKGNDNCPIKCKYCNKNFKQNTNLKRHIRIEHTDNPKIYKCEFCGKICNRLDNLKLHQRNSCPKKLKKLEFGVEKPIDTEKLLKCNYCSQDFPSHMKLALHKKNIHLSYNYKCKKCNKGFKSQEGLNTHKTLIHSTEFENLPFLCIYCGITFSEQFILDKHIINNHYESSRIVPNT